MELRSPPFGLAGRATIERQAEQGPAVVPFQL
jgi:hypothetical protein